MQGWGWFLVMLGLVVLGLAIFYGTWQSNIFRRNDKAVRRSEKAAKDLRKDIESRRER